MFTRSRLYWMPLQAEHNPSVAGRSSTLSLPCAWFDLRFVHMTTFRTGPIEHASELGANDEIVLTNGHIQQG